MVVLGADVTPLDVDYVNFPRVLYGKRLAAKFIMELWRS